MVASRAARAMARWRWRRVVWWVGSVGSAGSSVRRAAVVEGWWRVDFSTTGVLNCWGVSFWGGWAIGGWWVSRLSVRLSVSVILRAGAGAGDGDAPVIVVAAEGIEALLWTLSLVAVVDSRNVLAWIFSRVAFLLHSMDPLLPLLVCPFDRITRYICLDVT